MMTITGRPASVMSLGKEKVLAALDSDESHELEIRELVQTDRMRRERMHFGNSTAVNFKTSTDTKVCIKIFSNGVMHFAGCKNVDDFMAASAATCRAFKHDLVDFSIDMVNLQFYVNGAPDATKALDLDKLAEDLRLLMPTTRMIDDVIYNPDRFPGLRVKMGTPEDAPLRKRKRGAPTADKGATVMLFRNGCVKLCGLHDFALGIEPYEYIMSLFDDRWISLTT